ncbi:hypothetical protein RMATCC62417_05341 [Rhizopus microsporus]|nr:hypothetical protein RMATCC62417_05341 [Rhizopus microsporus]
MVTASKFFTMILIEGRAVDSAIDPSVCSNAYVYINWGVTRMTSGIKEGMKKVTTKQPLKAYLIELICINKLEFTARYHT